jgi:hypothetical protein
MTKESFSPPVTTVRYLFLKFLIQPFRRLPGTR